MRSVAALARLPIMKFNAIFTIFFLGPLIKKIKMEENLKTDEKINGDDQIKAESELTLTKTEPKKETLEELELSRNNIQLTKKLAMFENTLKSVQNDIVIPLKERITRLEVEKKGSHFLFFKLKKLPKGAFTYDVRCFGGIFDLPTLIR